MSISGDITACKHEWDFCQTCIEPYNAPLLKGTMEAFVDLSMLNKK